MAPGTRTLRTIQRLCLAVIAACIASGFLPVSAVTSIFILALPASIIGIAAAVVDIWVQTKGRPRHG